MSLQTNYLSEDNLASENHPDLLSKFSKRPKVIKSIKGDIHLPVFRDEMFSEFISHKEIHIEQMGRHEAEDKQIAEAHIEVVRVVEHTEEVKQVEKEEEKVSSPVKKAVLPIQKIVAPLRDDFIHSESSVHPNSFLTGCSAKALHIKNGKLETPSPYFVEVDKFQERPKLDKTSILEGMVINDKTGLVLVDHHIMTKFKGIIGNMISQLISSFFTGKPISLVVRLFEPKSTLQRIMDYWSFAPTFLKEACQIDSPVERLKKVITFALAGLYVPTKQLKPFNPNIGETFQGEFENGTKVYAEHISHYPTLAQFYIKDTDDDYNIHGYFDFLTSNESLGNKINIEQKGPIHIDFKGGKKGQIIYNMPTIKLLNARGEVNRSAIWVDYMVFVDVKNGLKGIVHLGGDSKCVHGFTGHIIEYNFPANYKYDIDKERKESAKLPKNAKILSQISGSWLKELKFDNVEYWNIDRYEPGFVKPCSDVLPSDGRYREDLIWLFRSFYSAKNEQERKKFEDYAQAWKLLIEQVQRHEREMKKKARTKRK
jgi:hypothetical protein